MFFANNNGGRAGSHFAEKKLGSPARTLRHLSPHFVATLVDFTGHVIDFAAARLVLRGTVL